MGYDNSYSLTITGEAKKSVPFCPTCKVEKQGKFCPECGTILIVEEVPKHKTEIIAELREYSDDCDFLLDENGSSNETGSGYDIEDSIEKFSKIYPSLIFQLDCDWDSGFGDDPSRYYFKNGVKKDANAKVIYDKPNFD